PLVADLTLGIADGAGERIRFGLALRPLAMQPAHQVNGPKKNVNPAGDLEPSQAEPPLVSDPVEEAICRITCENLNPVMRGWKGRIRPPGCPEPIEQICPVDGRFG